MCWEDMFLFLYDFFGVFILLLDSPLYKMRGS